MAAPGADIQAAVASSVSRLLSSHYLVEQDGELLVGETHVPRGPAPGAPRVSTSTPSVPPEVEKSSESARPGELARRFDARVGEDLATMEAGCGYRPSYFIHKMKTLGAVSAAQHMLTIDDQHYNLRRLAKNGLLEFSLHAAVLDPRFRSLFTDKELAVARERFTAHDGSV